MTSTVEAPTDNPLEIGERWPRWAVPAIALEAWLALQRAIRGMGRSPACERDPEAWWLAGRLPPGDRERQAAAVEACGWCPVRAHCLEYATAAREREGIWGGLTARERGWSR